MNIFAPTQSRTTEAYDKQGYVHLSGGVDPEFLAYCNAFLDAAMAERRALDNFAFKSKKEQYLFEFPEGMDIEQALMRPVSELTGLDLSRLTLCERHIKVYTEDASELPPPHKDRLASEVAMAVPLSVPAESRLALYPEACQKVNPYNTTAEWKQHMPEPETPEQVLRNYQPTLLDIRPGDIAMFPGSSVFHERLKPAHTRILYLKMNALGLDGLGEDPRTAHRLKASQLLEESTDDADLRRLTVDLSPRLEQLTVGHSRDSWQALYYAHIGAEGARPLRRCDFLLLKSLQGPQAVELLLAQARRSEAEMLRRVRRLAREGLLLLAPPAQAAPASASGSAGAKAAAAPRDADAKKPLAA